MLVWVAAVLCALSACGSSAAVSDSGPDSPGVASAQRQTMTPTAVTPTVVAVETDQLASELLLAALFDRRDTPLGFDFLGSAAAELSCPDAELTRLNTDMGAAVFGGPGDTFIVEFIVQVPDARSADAAADLFVTCAPQETNRQYEYAFRYEQGVLVALTGSSPSDAQQVVQPELLEELAELGLGRVQELTQVGLPQIVSVEERNAAQLDAAELPAGVSLLGRGPLEDQNCLDAYTSYVNEGAIASVYTVTGAAGEAFLVQQYVVRPHIISTDGAAEFYDQLCLYPEEGTLERTSEAVRGQTLVVHNIEPAHDDNPSLTVYRFEDGVLTVAFGFDDEYGAPLSQDLEDAMVAIVDLSATRLSAS